MRAAALAVAALALLAAAPAAAGFRYVPEGAGGGAGETAGPLGGVVTVPPEAGHGGPAPGPGPLLWRVREGETLRAVLARWGARVGADVTFLTDRRYRLDAAAVFEGAFGDAVEALLQGLNHLPHPPEGTLSADGGWLAVTHRVRRADEGENGP